MMKANKAANPRVAARMARFAASAAGLATAITLGERRASVRSIALPEEDVHRRRIASLSSRELEVVRRIVSGYSTKDIAQDLERDEQAIRQDLSSIYDKLGVSGRLELALFAVHYQLAV